MTQSISLHIPDQDSSTLSIYSTSFQFQPESPEPCNSFQLDSPDFHYLISPDSLTPTQDGFLCHHDGDFNNNNNNKKTFSNTTLSSPSSTSASSLSVSDGSPLSIDGLIEAEVRCLFLVLCKVTDPLIWTWYVPVIFSLDFATIFQPILGVQTSL